MLFFIYKTTCIVTDEYYYGMHSTPNLEDGYMGSGVNLKASIEKHGCENHRREIVLYCLSREIMIAKEEEIVNQDLLKDPK